ncbi:MAG: helix-hairpin-helix domain-containing protein [Candidatus Omnitrophota bacterium]
MKYSFYEKLVLVILSVLLLAGSVILYIRHSRPYREITIVENGVKEELSISQVEELLREKRKINVNEASADELTVVPGIGEVLAGRIIEYKKQHGNFYSTNDLLDVPGIGEKKLEKIKEYVKFQ